MNWEEDQVNMNETLVLLGGEDHKFIRMKVVTMLTQVAGKDTDVNKMENNNLSIRRRWWEEVEMQQCCKMLVLAKSVAKRETKERQRRKESTAKSLHHTCQMCHSHTQGYTADSQYSWRNPWWAIGVEWGWWPPADETIITTSEQDTTIKDDEIEGQSIEEKMTAAHR